MGAYDEMSSFQYGPWGATQRGENCRCRWRVDAAGHVMFSEWDWLCTEDHTA